MFDPDAGLPESIGGWSTSERAVPRQNSIDLYFHCFPACINRAIQVILTVKTSRLLIHFWATVVLASHRSYIAGVVPSLTGCSRLYGAGNRINTRNFSVTQW